MKTASRAVLVLYVAVLIWLVLFKFSYDIVSVILHYQTRSLNLIPFSGSSHGSLSEMLSNFIVFIPFGLLLGINFKQASIWRNLAIIFTFSLTVEFLQYVLAIGATDINDLISNTLGGLVGLTVYDFGKRYISEQKVDRFVVIGSGAVLIALILLRIFVFRVRY